MTRLNELAARLTPAQMREVEDFVEFLISRGTTSVDPSASTNEPKTRVRFDGWAGCLAGVEPEKSDKELVRDAWNEVIDKYE